LHINQSNFIIEILLNMKQQPKDSTNSSEAPS